MDLQLVMIIIRYTLYQVIKLLDNGDDDDYKLFIIYLYAKIYIKLVE